MSEFSDFKNLFRLDGKVVIVTGGKTLSEVEENLYRIHWG
jgi:hypothetical protein